MTTLMILTFFYDGEFRPINDISAVLMKDTVEFVRIAAFSENHTQDSCFCLRI